MLAVAQTSFWLVALPVLGTLLGLLIGQFAPEVFRRRAAAQARYDDAIAAVGKLFAVRHGINPRFPAEYAGASDQASHEAAQQELSRSALTRYFDATAEARTALAVLYPWSADLRPYWDQPFIDEKDFEVLIGLLSERREFPLARYDESGTRVSRSRRFAR